MASREQLQDTLCKRLFWHTAERDDGKVADYLFHRHEMDVVYAMDEATLFDSFFNYLQDIEVYPFLEHLDPKNQRRKNVPFAQILLVYLMKVVGSIKKSQRRLMAPPPQQSLTQPSRNSSKLNLSPASLHGQDLLEGFWP